MTPIVSTSHICNFLVYEFYIDQMSSTLSNSSPYTILVHGTIIPYDWLFLIMVLINHNFEVADKSILLCVSKILYYMRNLQNCECEDEDICWTWFVDLS